MRIVFAGTPEFAATALAAILDAAPAHGWTVPLVLSQPDRPAGRGLKVAASPVKQLAQSRSIAVATPDSLRKGESAAAAQARLGSVAPDVLVVAAYGLILPPAVLEIPSGLRPAWRPRLTAINLHASLLPRWRGAAPVARAIEAGDVETGITLMQMDAGLDTGPMLAAESIAIPPDATTVSLTSDLAGLGARMIVAALERPDALVACPQPDGASYAAKLDKEEAWLDWSDTSATLERKVRAFDPFPVAATLMRGVAVKLWRARIETRPDNVEPGTVIEAGGDGVVVACGDGALRLTELQRAGGRRLGAREFLAGFPLRAGERLLRPDA